MSNCNHDVGKCRVDFTRGRARQRPLFTQRRGRRGVGGVPARLAPDNDTHELARGRIMLRLYLAFIITLPLPPLIYVEHETVRANGLININCRREDYRWEGEGRVAGAGTRFTVYFANRPKAD